MLASTNQEIAGHQKQQENDAPASSEKWDEDFMFCHGLVATEK